MKSQIISWGRLQSLEHQVVELEARANVADIMRDHAPVLAHGLGRSYGDVALNPDGILLKTSRLARFLGFDAERGILHCEAGVSLHEIQRVMMPKGWSLPVMPGTQYVSVGGATANDIHGKNHHLYGSFGNQLIGLTLQRSDGSQLVCNKQQNSDYFAATIGGIGLTGIILDAHLQLRRISGPWLETQTMPFVGLDDFCALSGESQKTWEYTVAWIDCLARQPRGLFMRANHSKRHDTPMVKKRKRNVFFTPPFSVFNAMTLPLLNRLYYHVQSRHAGRDRQQLCVSFFYPLDSVANWNRLYGRRGFYQYQCVVPEEGGRYAIEDMLKIIAANGQGSFLAVLKSFGETTPQGLLSFPQKGITLALDFPNRGASTLALFDKLDEVVITAGGRIYLAKDARMSSATFKATYKRWDEFMKFHDKVLSSAMSRRLMGV